jgi:hypothetical protein
MSRLTTRVSAQLVLAAQLRTASRPALLPAVWDVLAMLPLAAELGFHRSVTARSAADLARELELTNWSKKDAPYAIGVPRPVVAVLEDMQAGSVFEKAVAAAQPTRTPTWYVRELALHAYERAFQEQISVLVDLLAGWYPTTAKQLADAGMPDAVGAVLSRGVEVAWKLGRHIEEWEPISAELRAGPLLVDLVRPEWDWPAIRAKVNELRGELLRQLAASIALQVLRERDPDIPDYLGEAVHRVGEASFEALADNNDELFAELFPTYFIGVLVIVTRIQEQVVDWQPSMAANAIAEPVIDAMDLSGYVLIFSELHGNPRPWETCTTAWRRYLEASEGADRLKIIAAMHNHQRHVFGITHRAIGRTRWQMALNRILGGLPRDQPSYPFGDGAVQHDSALIRRIAPDQDLIGSVFHASDIFVVRYLQRVDGGEALDFGVAQWVGDELAAIDSDKDADENGEGNE